MKNGNVCLCLVVIRVPDIDRASEFYRLLGIDLIKDRHGNGPVHYCAELEGFVFEIYPSAHDDQKDLPRLGFVVKDLDETLATLMQNNVRVLHPPASSEWGRRAIVKDFSGHTVELTQVG